MDKRALYRAKLKEQKQKRIDSPLVRYDEHDQPVCRVCDIVLKSESQWPGHQASRKHHDAIQNLKASAASVKSPNNVKSEPQKDFPKPKPQHKEPEPSVGFSKPRASSTVPPNFFDQQKDFPKPKPQHKEPEPSVGFSKSRASSSLPPKFFDQQETKRPKIGKDSSRLGDHVSSRDAPVSDQTEEVEPSLSTSIIQDLSTSKNAETRSMENQQSGENGPISKPSSGSDAKQVKGALPAGFFDNKDADLRARGITPIKPDVKDEYKEFEKSIQEDLKEVDNRLEEEEVDAAEMIEEEVSVEQKAYKEKLEMLRKKRIELKAARSSLATKDTKVATKESSDDESSSDGDSDENLTVDWRAKHL